MNNKSFTVKDHIGIFDNYFTDGLCEKYIHYFDKVTVSQRDNFNLAEDKYLFLMNEHFHNELNLTYIGADFQKIFWEKCYPEYIKKYPIIKDFKAHRILDLKIQKIEKTQGYHKWHNEMMNSGTRNRFATFILYLNTVEQGGETEFLNQSLRIDPVKNRFVLFPATYTHVHRGNPPLSGTKYIITGWVEFGFDNAGL
jgi:hypothetical protein